MSVLGLGHAKNVLILGASGVLGSALASQFQKEGTGVWGTGCKRKPALKDSIQLDAASELEVKRLAEWVDQQMTSLDVVIHALGVVSDGLISSQSEESWNKVVDVNLKSAYLISKALLPKMVRQRSGHFIFISSWGALAGRKGQVNYSAAKAGLIGFVQSLAREYASRNIRANCVIPGVFQSPMLKDLSPENLEKIWEGAALREFADMDEMTRFICHLAMMKGVTGQTFHLDGRIPSVLG